MFSLFRWESEYSSISLALAKEFAKQHRVFYINHPYSYKDFYADTNKSTHDVIQRRKKGLLAGKVQYEIVETYNENNEIVCVIPPMTIPINWLPKGKLYNSFQRKNNQVIINTIHQIIKDYNIRNFVYYNCYNPLFLGYLPPSDGLMLNVYHCVDDTSQNTYMQKHAFDIENDALANTDLPLVTSSELKRIKSVYSDKIQILANGADTTLFQKSVSENFPRPPELENVTGKIIGFTGNLDSQRIDYKLLKKIALHHPDKTLLLVGPVNNTEYKTIGLDALPNVIFAGAKKIEELPPYLKYCDCCIIPFLCNTLTKSIYPLKINEYLAAGKSVVSTNFSEDISSFKPYIYLVENHTEFINKINAAIAEYSPEKIATRIDVAKTNAWAHRIEHFHTLVNTFKQNKHASN